MLHNSSISANSTNLDPLSAVIVLKTLLNLSPKKSRILTSSFVTASTVLDSILLTMAFLVLRSTIVKSTLSSLDFSPIT